MIHEFKIGDWRALIILDRASKEPAEGTVRNWPPERLEQELRAFGEFPEITIDYNILAVQTPQGWLLADGGQGPLTGHQGQLIEALGTTGIAPEDIAFIFLSHCHADHFGTLVHPETGALNFPNARYLTSTAEWNVWTNEAQLASYRENNFMYYRVVTERLMPIQRRLTLVQSGEAVAPGMTTVASSGHTPGHLSLLIRNGDDALLYIGDAAIHPLHLKYPDAVFFNDSDPVASAASRRDMLRLARETGARILACHFKFPGFCELPADWPVEAPAAAG